MRTRVFIGTSLDGFIAKENGDIDWLVAFASPEVNGAYEEFIKDIDAIVIGRGTFETVLSFPSWPYEQKVFVLSTTLKQLPDKVNGKATLVSMKPGELLAYLSHEGFSRVYVDGGNVIQGFLREDRIDELTITRAPVVLGSGIPLFGDLDNDLKFKHLDTRVYSNGLVKSRYERDKE
jgi:dihydrofolate reductase